MFWTSQDTTLSVKARETNAWFDSCTTNIDIAPAVIQTVCPRHLSKNRGQAGLLPVDVLPDKAETVSRRHTAFYCAITWYCTNHLPFAQCGNKPRMPAISLTYRFAVHVHALSSPIIGYEKPYHASINVSWGDRILMDTGEV
jgi:hypothetical protein